MSEECPMGTMGASHEPDNVWDDMLVRDLGRSEGNSCSKRGIYEST
jgi:hypothetical protein